MLLRPSLLPPSCAPPEHRGVQQNDGGLIGGRQVQIVELLDRLTLVEGGLEKVQQTGGGGGGGEGRNGSRNGSRRPLTSSHGSKDFGFGLPLLCQLIVVPWLPIQLAVALPD